MSATTGLSERLETTVRSVIDASMVVEGRKRGLWRAAELLGVSERWIRSFRYGEPTRIAVETYLRAIEAQQTLRNERRAQLMAELLALGEGQAE